MTPEPPGYLEIQRKLLSFGMHAKRALNIREKSPVRLKRDLLKHAYLSLADVILKCISQGGARGGGVPQFAGSSWEGVRAAFPLEESKRRVFPVCSARRRGKK